MPAHERRLVAGMLRGWANVNMKRRNYHAFELREPAMRQCTDPGFLKWLNVGRSQVGKGVSGKFQMNFTANAQLIKGLLVASDLLLWPGLSQHSVQALQMFELTFALL